MAAGGVARSMGTRVRAGAGRWHLQRRRPLSSSKHRHDPQAETNTWCKRAEEPKAMAAWAGPIVEQVVRIRGAVHRSSPNRESLHDSQNPTLYSPPFFHCMQ